ncbi:hydroxymethylglutaryl-CoA synthase [Kitasatospora albolonga]|uniref:hydroxymethylglutaryl-CoA synthase n=1 Tax=Kitasatospora albolonga TaxID=68173 RepID=UPI0035E8AE46
MPADPPVGIHDLTFATTSLVLTHEELARHTRAPLAKYHHGIGQRAMSVPAVDEDVVTLAADAGKPVVERHGTGRIRTLMFATETGIDQSKAAGVYVHRLLGLASHTRVIELKQACYAGTAALQLACTLVRSDPAQEVLVLASDIARYDLDSPGEATQGAAAVAVLVAADPAIAVIPPPSGLYTRDVMDFWRPNYRTTALVDGKKSVEAYLEAVDGTWQDYRARNGIPFEGFRAVCYHQPFTRMAHKAHRRLMSAAGVPHSPEAVLRAVGSTTAYNETLGNSYTASLYLALTALLDSGTVGDGEHVGLFSYGSGCVAEFLAATLQPGHRSALRTEAHLGAIAHRTPVSYEVYRELRNRELPTDGAALRLPHQSQGWHRLAGIDSHQRLYEHTGT